MRSSTDAIVTLVTARVDVRMRDAQLDVAHAQLDVAPAQVHEPFAHEQKDVARLELRNL